MSNAESSLSMSHLGHVKNGVVVLDGPALLAEGQAVRIETLASDVNSQSEAEISNRVGQLQQLFDQWTEEDGQLSDVDADRLHTALECNRGLSFRTADV